MKYWQTVFRSSFIILLIYSNYSLAQTSVSLSGRITDSKSGQPVQFVSVFLARTSFGAMSNENGEFKITGVPHGKYDLIMSIIGYKLKNIPVLISNDNIQIPVVLEEDPKYLKEVVITTDRFYSKKIINDFKRFFIGETRNAQQCNIENFNSIDLDYDPSSKILKASCAEPIIISNLALGYKVTYILNEFKVDFEKRICIIVGVPRFEELKPKNTSQARRWDAERKRAYLGSLTHVLRSMKFHCLKDDGFELYVKCSGLELPISARSLFNQNSDSVMVSDCQLKIVYTKERNEAGYPDVQNPVNRPQISYLTLKDHKLTTYDNGYYQRQTSLELDGYYAWSEKIAELMPLDYYLQVHSKK